MHPAANLTRRERTRILVEAGPDLRGMLAAEVREAHTLRVLQAPTRGLVMLQLRESAKRSRFLMGETIVTEAKVQLGTAIGLGIIAGDDPQAALDLAAIDAAWNASVPELSAWQERLRVASAALRASAADEDAKLLETRVRFDTMELT